MNNKLKESIPSILTYGALIIITTFIIIPFLWAISTSFKDEADIISSTITLLPSPATFKNYIEVWTVSKFSVYFKNSLFNAGMSSIFIIFFSILNGYALSRFKFKGKSVFMIIMLASQMIPMLMTIIPLFVIYKNMGLINKPASLIITYVIFQLPFNTLLMKGFIGNIPAEVDEAAMIDGCGRMRYILTVLTPIIVPGLVATGAFAFIGAWNDFFVAFSFVTNPSQYTISVGLKSLIGEFSVKFGAIAAGSMIALIPPIALFAYIQKYLIQGLASGAVKG